MKSLLVIAAILAVAYAQYPAYNQQFPGQYSGRDAPYQPRGWRPSGPRFELPARQQLPKFEPPPQTYGPPAEEYGPPDAATTTEVPETTTTDLPTTTQDSQQAGQLNEVEQNDEKKSGQLTEGNPAVTQQGVYYIYHPTGLLQKVVYRTQDDARNMAYTAQLKYENVEPIRAPIFTYDPQSFIFQRIQF